VYYIGCDLSLTGTGVVVIDENGNIIKEQLISTKSTQLIEVRIIEIWSKIRQIISEYPCVNIHIEGLSYGSKGASTLDLAGLNLFIRINLMIMDQKFTIIPPTVLKKFISGKGNIKKNIVLKEIYKKFGKDFSDDNLADAFVLSEISRNKDNK